MQANLLLRLYGESRGRAAEYWGPSNLELDRWVQLNGVPERAKAWYDAQNPTFRSYLDAFARGINDFAKAHPEAIDADERVVLPVSGVDVVGGNGGPSGLGLFRTIAFTRKVGNRYYAANGETIVCAIEFGPSQQARCTLGYGNSTQAGSPHLEDQLPLMVQKTLHPVWREKKDIEANLEKSESF